MLAVDDFLGPAGRLARQVKGFVYRPQQAEMARAVSETVAQGGVLIPIRHHHERWDGSGFPDGLRNDDIPLIARVLEVADSYDAITSDRPYSPATVPG